MILIYCLSGLRYEIACKKDGMLETGTMVPDKNINGNKLHLSRSESCTLPPKIADIPYWGNLSTVYFKLDSLSINRYLSSQKLHI